MMAAWLLFGSLGWAAAWDAARAEQALARLAPPLSAVLGRDVAATPATVLPWPDWVQQQRPGIVADLVEDGVPEPDAQKHAGRVIDEMLASEGTLAVYDASTRQIAVFPDHLASLIAAMPALPDGMADDLMGCVLAHELTHAAQDQHGVFARLVGQDPSEPAVMMVEGHAEWAAEQVCDPAASALLGLQWGQGFAWDRSLEEGYGRYALGKMYIRDHAEDAWTLLRSPPSRHQIQSVLAVDSTPYLTLQHAGEALFAELAGSFYYTAAATLSRSSSETLAMVSALGRDGLAASRTLTRMTQHALRFQLATGSVGELSVLLIDCEDAQVATALREAAASRPRARPTRGVDGVTFRHDDGRRPEGIGPGGPDTYTLVQHDTLVVLVRQKGASLSAGQLRRLLADAPRQE